VLRTNKPEDGGKFPVYARITVNKTRCEFSLKQSIHENDWNFGKGMAKPKNAELREFNSYLQQIQGNLARHYRELQVQELPLSATAVKSAFVGVKEEKTIYTMLWLANQHNTMMQQVLKGGSMKNYYTTERYLKLFLKKRYASGDVPLTELNYEFISAFDYYVRNNPIKANDPCTNNGTMKHMERLKKMVTWAVKNEWLSKNPLGGFQLKFRRREVDFLDELELAAIEGRTFENIMLQKVRDLFVFSCYTGLSYIDLMDLKPQDILRGIDEVKWIRTTRAKTDVPVNVPLLKTAEEILKKYLNSSEIRPNEAIFPYISNQEMNRSLKNISEICGIQKYLTFHLARHTFATTVTLMNGVPIETISKMLGHSKLSTTMIYARVTQTKIGMDMSLLQNKLNKNASESTLKAVK